MHERLLYNLRVEMQETLLQSQAKLKIYYFKICGLQREADCYTEYAG